MQQIAPFDAPPAFTLAKDVGGAYLPANPRSAIHELSEIPMRLCVVVAAATLAGTTAFAGNLDPVAAEPVAAPPPARVVAPVRDWTGGYVGAQISYADVDQDGQAGAAGLSAEGDGLLGGLRFGYDAEFGRAVVGGLLQYERGSFDLAGSLYGPGGETPEVEAVLRAGLRVGAALGDNLLFGQGGYAHAYGNDRARDEGGYFLGLGYERFLTDRMTVGLEANYHEFDTDLADTDVVAASASLNFRF